MVRSSPRLLPPLGCVSTRGARMGRGSSSTTSVTRCACAPKRARCIAPKSSVPLRSAWMSSTRTVCAGSQNQRHSGRSRPNAAHPECAALTMARVSTRDRCLITGQRSRPTWRDVSSTVSVRREPLNADPLANPFLHCHRATYRVIHVWPDFCWCPTMIAVSTGLVHQTLNQVRKSIFKTLFLFHFF